MPYREYKGNLFASQAQCLVNTVNCVGVMGKGVALEFRRRFPNMFEEYRRVCEAGTLRRVGQDEFRKTARKINRRAQAIGTDADYDERWGAGR